MFEKLIEFLKKSNEDGLPIPLLRDNQTDKGSVSLTMFWISFNVCIIALAGKANDLFGGIDYSSTLWLLGITGSFYLGKSFKSDSKGIEVKNDRDE